MDAIIAATALAHGLTVWTQDDVDVLAELEPALRIHRGGCGLRPRAIALD